MFTFNVIFLVDLTINHQAHSEWLHITRPLQITYILHPHGICLWPDHFTSACSQPCSCLSISGILPPSIEVSLYGKRGIYLRPSFQIVGNWRLVAIEQSFLFQDPIMTVQFPLSYYSTVNNPWIAKSKCYTPTGHLINALHGEGEESVNGPRPLKQSFVVKVMSSKVGAQIWVKDKVKKGCDMPFVEVQSIAH